MAFVPNFQNKMTEPSAEITKFNIITISNEKNFNFLYENFYEHFMKIENQVDIFYLNILQTRSAV